MPKKILWIYLMRFPMYPVSDRPMGARGGPHPDWCCTSGPEAGAPSGCADVLNEKGLEVLKIRTWKDLEGFLWFSKGFLWFSMEDMMDFYDFLWKIWWYWWCWWHWWYFILSLEISLQSSKEKHHKSHEIPWIHDIPSGNLT